MCRMVVAALWWRSCGRSWWHCGKATRRPSLQSPSLASSGKWSRASGTRHLHLSHSLCGLFCLSPPPQPLPPFSFSYVFCFSLPWLFYSPPALLSLSSPTPTSPPISFPLNLFILSDPIQSTGCY